MGSAAFKFTRGNMNVEIPSFTAECFCENQINTVVFTHVLTSGS